jgi:hypothetical protein
MTEPYAWDQLLEDTEADRADPSKQAYLDYKRGEGAGKAEPQEFYQYGNKATQRINALWSRWTGMPEGTQGYRNQHKCVARLLTAIPDVDLIETAVNNLARAGRFQHGVDMYLLRKLVENEASKARATADKWTSGMMAEYLPEESE